MLGRNRKNIGGPPARQRRRGKWIAALVVTVVVAVVAAVVLVVQPWTAEFRHGGLTIADPPALVEPDSQLTPVAATAPVPDRQALADALAQVATNPDLGKLGASVSDPATGTTLWSADADRPMIPASTMKIMTVAAALLVLPPEHRLSTRVVAGAAPGEVVLVGGGDPTLTAQADGNGYYPHGPELSDLVEQIRASGHPVTSVVVDTSRYSGPTWPVGWDPIDIAGGSWAPIQPVMIDGGRLNPLEDYSPRSATPALDAGRRLAAELGADPATVHLGKASDGAAQLARVDSGELRYRLQTMMLHSDDVLAEAIGREIAAATGEEQSFAGAAAATTTALRAAGFDTTGVTQIDNSGLSTENRVPARLLDSILTQAAAYPGVAAPATSGTNAPPSTGPTGPSLPATGSGTSDSADSTASPLAPMLDLLPVAGGTGTLTARFVAGPERAGAGWVRAKTGTLSVSSTLAGYVLDRDGRIMTFALMSNDRPPEVSRPALDAVATALRNCGCS